MPATTTSIEILIYDLLLRLVNIRIFTCFELGSVSIRFAVFLITFYHLHWHHSDHSAPFGRVTQAAEKSSTALACFGRCTCSKMLDAGYTIWNYFLRFGLKLTPFIWNSNGEVRMYSWNHIEILSPGNNWFQICWSHVYFFFVYREWNERMRK